MGPLEAKDLSSAVQAGLSLGDAVDCATGAAGFGGAGPLGLAGPFGAEGFGTGDRSITLMRNDTALVVVSAVESAEQGALQQPTGPPAGGGGWHGAAAGKAARAKSTPNIGPPKGQAQAQLSRCESSGLCVAKTAPNTDGQKESQVRQRQQIERCSDDLELSGYMFIVSIGV